MTESCVLSPSDIPLRRNHVAGNLELLIGKESAEQLNAEQSLELELRMLLHRLHKATDENTELQKQCNSLQAQLDSAERLCAELSYKNANLEGRLSVTDLTSERMMQLLSSICKKSVHCIKLSSL